MSLIKKLSFFGICFAFVVIALGASVGGHPHHRIGDRYDDLKEMGHDVDNPAGL